jgi:hypothetical protein
VRIAAGLEEIVIHTFRHSFGTVGIALGYSEAVINVLLGHARPGMTARYAHVPDALTQQAAHHISATIAGYLGLDYLVPPEATDTKPAPIAAPHLRLVAS